MTDRTLLEKIDALTADKRAEVEDFVEFLASRGVTGVAPEPGPLDSEMDAIRNRLLEAHGLFETLPLIHEYRDQLS